MKTEKRHIECDCEHITSERIMIHSWLDGRVKIFTYFGTLSKSTVIIDDEEKCTYSGLTVPEFTKVVMHCQDIADRLTRESAA